MRVEIIASAASAAAAAVVLFATTTPTSLVSAFLYPTSLPTHPAPSSQSSNHRSASSSSSSSSSLSSPQLRHHLHHRPPLSESVDRHQRKGIRRGGFQASNTALAGAFDGMSLAELEKIEESWTNKYSPDQLELSTTCDYVYMKPDGTEIAYTATYGTSNVTVYYMAAFDSTVNDVKANVIKDDCIKNNRTFIMADWYGCGNSSGFFETGTITKWTEDTITMLENIVPTEKAVLVGGGIGGWIAFLVAKKRPELVCGLVGLAADPDFTEKLLWRYLPEIKKEEIMSEGFSNIVWGGKFQTISRVLIEDAKNNLILDGPEKGMQLRFPIRLIHGLDDEEVPYTVALELSSRISCDDMQVILINSGGHHLNSNVTDFSVIKRCVDEACTRWKPYVRPRRIKEKPMEIIKTRLPTTILDTPNKEPEEIEYEYEDETEEERMEREAREEEEKQERRRVREEEQRNKYGDFEQYIEFYDKNIYNPDDDILDVSERIIPNDINPLPL